MATDYKYETFVTWAERQGVKINSVHLSKIPNQGLGIVADRNIEVRSGHSMALSRVLRHLPAR